MNNRIEILLDEIDMSPSLFADAIGVQRATISHILSGRNNPSLDFVQKVLARFPNINPDWILSGKGDVWRKSAKENTEPESQAAESLKQKRQSNLFTEEKTDEAFSETNRDKASGKKTVAESARKESKEQNPLVPEKKLPPTGVSQNKQIVKVIVLYDDHTFEDYSGV